MAEPSDNYKKKTVFYKKKTVNRSYKIFHESNCIKKLNKSQQSSSYGGAEAQKPKRT
jgi:hypothetical protein